jgi:hypothetical protein
MTENAKESDSDNDTEIRYDNVKNVFYGTNYRDRFFVAPLTTTKLSVHLSQSFF